jgi:tRNA pseudouridine55 synthase
MRHGFILINKPVGPTSHDIVYRVRRALPERKIGHLGTLDPAASGLLVLAVGAKALKVVELFTDLSKEYIADVTFGTVSVTYDREGPFQEFERKPGIPDPEDITIQETIRNRFIGKVSQVPPTTSAIKIGGERAYRKMRQGRDVEMPTREVDISYCDLLSYTYPNLQIKVGCSSGTYIRSLAHDLGQSLKCGAYLSGLQRTKVGDFSLDDAVAPDDAIWGKVIPLKDVLASMEKKEISQKDFDDISNGRIIDGSCTKNTVAWLDGLPVALLENGKEGGIKARKVL